MHAYEDYKQLNVYTSGLGKIKNSRTVTITTNGTVRDGPLDEKITMSNQVLNGEDNLLGLLPIIYKVTDKDSVDIPMVKYLRTKNKSDIDVTVWVQANPSLRYRPTLLNELIKDFVKMQKQKSYRVEFYAKRMNLPQQNEEEAVADWPTIEKASYSDTKNKIPRQTGNIEGRKAIIGIDYASLNDFASAGFLFKIDDEYIWRQRTWICSKSKFYGDIKFPFDFAGQDGYNDFTVVNTDSIDAEEIILWLISEMSKYNIQKWVMDNYRFILLNV